MKIHLLGVMNTGSNMSGYNDKIDQILEVLDAMEQLMDTFTEQLKIVKRRIDSMEERLEDIEDDLDDIQGTSIIGPYPGPLDS